MKTKSVKINDIVIDGGTQQREKIDLAIVSEYSESMRCGSKFPPVIVFFDGFYPVLVIQNQSLYAVNSIPCRKSGVEPDRKIIF